MTVGDVIGHDLDPFLIRVFGRARWRRGCIVDRLAVIAPAYLSWARQDGGSAPSVAPEHADEVRALTAEYRTL